MANDSLSSVYKEFLFGGMEPSSPFNLLKTTDNGRKDK